MPPNWNEVQQWLSEWNGTAHVSAGTVGTSNTPIDGTVGNSNIPISAITTEAIIQERDIRLLELQAELQRNEWSHREGVERPTQTERSHALKEKSFKFKHE